MEIAGARFNIIHHYGDPKVAKLDDGTLVHKQEKVWIDEYENFVRCLDYGVHFVALFPKSPKYKWFAFCSCGSAAILLGSNLYAKEDSGKGMVLACLHHATYGKHADGIA